MNIGIIALIIVGLLSLILFILKRFNKKEENGICKKETSVYVTENGTKYHKGKCGSSGNFICIPLSKARAEGYEPCGRCYRTK